MNRSTQATLDDSGYAMAAMLVALGVMAVMLTVAMPAWRTLVQREKEEELIFRGQQYVRAIGLFQRKYAASFPPSIQTLVDQRFLRKKYKDPMVSDGEFQVLYQTSQLAGQSGRGGLGAPGPRGQPGATTQGGPSGSGGRGAAGGTLGPRGGIIGVTSKSTAESIRLYNGRSHYNEWQFIYAPSLQPGQGRGRPGMLGGRGGRGMFGPGTGQGPQPGGFGPGGRRGFGPGSGFGPGGGARGQQQQPRGSGGPG